MPEEKDFMSVINTLYLVCNGFTSCIDSTLSGEKKYRIELTKREIEENDEDVRLNLCIYDIKYDRGFNIYFERDRLSNNQNYLSINIVVKKEYYKAIVVQFIESFYTNHIVTHASLDTLESRIAIHNSHFELCIKYTSKEKDWAESLKTSINERLSDNSEATNYPSKRILCEK